MNKPNPEEQAQRNDQRHPQPGRGEHPAQRCHGDAIARSCQNTCASRCSASKPPTGGMKLSMATVAMLRINRSRSCQVPDRFSGSRFFRRGGQFQIHSFQAGVFLSQLLTQARPTVPRNRKLAPVDNANAVGNFFGQVPSVWVDMKMVIPAFARSRSMSFTRPHAARVEANHRFIEHQHGRIVQQGGGKHQSLLHAVRIAFGHLIDEFRQTRNCEFRGRFAWPILHDPSRTNRQ